MGNNGIKCECVNEGRDKQTTATKSQVRSYPSQNISCNIQVNVITLPLVIDTVSDVPLIISAAFNQYLLRRHRGNLLIYITSTPINVIGCFGVRDKYHAAVTKTILSVLKDGASLLSRKSLCS